MWERLRNFLPGKAGNRILKDVSLRLSSLNSLKRRKTMELVPSKRSTSTTYT